MSNFKARHDALDQKAALLYAEFKSLQDEIAKSGKHHEGFRRLKKTTFHLEKIARQNGNLPRGEREQGAPPHADLFIRKPSALEAKPRQTPAAPDLFNKVSPPAISRDTEVRNAAPPDLFNRKGRVSYSHPPIPEKKEKPAKDPKRKVLSDSEEKYVD